MYAYCAVHTYNIMLTPNFHFHCIRLVSENHEILVYVKISWNMMYLVATTTLHDYHIY